MKINEMHLGCKLFFIFIFIVLLSTIIFYLFTRNLNFDSGYVGAYINLLNADATLYAAITAYLLVDRWKHQHNAQKLSDYAEEAWKLLNQENDLLYSLKIQILQSKFDNSFLRSIEYINFEKFYNEMHKNTASINLCLDFNDLPQLVIERNDDVKSIIAKLQNKFLACFLEPERQSDKERAKKTIQSILDDQIKKNEQLKVVFKKMIILEMK